MPLYEVSVTESKTWCVRVRGENPSEASDKAVELIRDMRLAAEDYDQNINYADIVGE